MEKEVSIISPWYLVTGYMEVSQSFNLITSRVVKHWNRLSEEVVGVLYLSVFKRHVDNAFNDLF